MKRRWKMNQVVGWCMLALMSICVGIAFADQTPGGGFERERKRPTWRSTSAVEGNLYGVTKDTSAAVELHGAHAANVYLNTTQVADADSGFVGIAYSPDGSVWFSPVTVDTLIGASTDKLIDLKSTRITSQLGFDPTNVWGIRLHMWAAQAGGGATTDSSKVTSYWNTLWDRQR